MIRLFIGVNRRRRARPTGDLSALDGVRPARGKLIQRKNRSPRRLILGVKPFRLRRPV